MKNGQELPPAARCFNLKWIPRPSINGDVRDPCRDATASNINLRLVRQRCQGKREKKRIEIPKRKGSSEEGDHENAKE
jgi:hypothetical protein